MLGYVYLVTSRVNLGRMSGLGCDIVCASSLRMNTTS